MSETPPDYPRKDPEKVIEIAPELDAIPPRLVFHRCVDMALAQYLSQEGSEREVAYAILSCHCHAILQSLTAPPPSMIHRP